MNMTKIRIWKFIKKIPIMLLGFMTALIIGQKLQEIFLTSKQGWGGEAIDCIKKDGLGHRLM